MKCLEMSPRKFLCLWIYIFLQYIIIEAKNAQLQYILMWTSNNLHPFDAWKNGQETFFDRKCPVTDCYLTSSRNFFGDDVTKFDAVVFNGRSLDPWKLTDIPKKRSPHQKYIFLNMESADNEPFCGPVYDEFFNMTATYKLDSDIVYSYILIKNTKGEEVGPTINMTWVDDMTPINKMLISTLNKKSKAAAWFVSNCRSRNGRDKYGQKLKAALKKYNLDLDIYGKCGDLSCPRSDEQRCHKMLEDQYYFYLSFENTFAEDYVTEKLLTALDHNLIPIVFGGANYSRFLPPGSYLDARSMEPQELAARMAHIIANPAELRDFFRWRNHYTYHYPEGVCRLCAVLNNNTLLTYVYDDFRGWWNPDHKKRCSGSTVLATPWVINLVLAVYWMLHTTPALQYHTS